ncbi:TPA: hypothetical protein ACGRTY_003102, partial [Escherichia coli]
MRRKRLIRPTVCIVAGLIRRGKRRIRQRQSDAAQAPYPTLYYPSCAEKIGQFSLPAVRMPYPTLGSNLR